jgi:hypothetical protein
MKMYKVFIEGWREHLVGKIEMEYLVMVFGDKAQVTAIELTSTDGSSKLDNHDETTLRAKQEDSH